MPIYICNNCGTVGYDIYSLTYDPIKNEYFCPKCRSYDVEEIPEEKLIEGEKDERKNTKTN